MSKRINRTKFTVLGMLSIEPMTGYDIIQATKESTAFFWAESVGQIYPALTKCTEEGLVTCKELQAKSSNRAKKIYRITKKGKKELTDWLSLPVYPTQIRNELLLKLFFGDNSTSDDNHHHLKQFKKESEIRLKEYKKIKKEIIESESNSPHAPYWLMTINYGERITKAQLAWAKDSLIEIDKLT